MMRHNPYSKTSKILHAIVLLVFIVLAALDINGIITIICFFGVLLSGMYFCNPSRGAFARAAAEGREPTPEEIQADTLLG